MSATPNTCVFCSRECQFLSSCDGCCLNCGDAMQLAMRDGQSVIQGFVKAVRACVEAESRLAKAVRLLRPMAEKDDGRNEDWNYNDPAVLCVGDCRAAARFVADYDAKEGRQ